MLGELLVEAKRQYAAIGIREPLNRGGQAGRGVDEHETVVLDADRVEPRKRLVIEHLTYWRIERGRVMRGQHFECLQALFGLDLQVLRDLDHRRRALRARAQFDVRVLHLQRQLLQPARNVNRPAAVAEMALQLTEDRRYRERREDQPTVRIE